MVHIDGPPPVNYNKTSYSPSLLSQHDIKRHNREIKKSRKIRIFSTDPIPLMVQSLTTPPPPFTLKTIHGDD